YHIQAPKMWEAGQATAKRGDDILLLSTHTSIESNFNQKIIFARKLHEAARAAGVKIYGKPGSGDRYQVSDEFRKFALDQGALPWSYRRTDIHKAVEQGMVESINRSKGTNISREEFLQECRASCDTEEQWKRQYLCEPSSDASALLPYALLLTCAVDPALCFTRPETWQNLYQGVDFGRRRHLSVIANGEMVGDILWTRELRRMFQTPWHQQLM